MDSVVILFAVAVIGAISLAVRHASKDGKSVPAGYHCLDCGTTSSTRRETSPFGVFALVLWLVAIGAALVTHWAWIFLGVVGHVVADRTHKHVCVACGRETVVPADTPAAKAHIAQLTDRSLR